MSSKTIQDLFPLVEKPSRYLGCEINTVRKNHQSVKLKTVLAFPDLYEIGTSHFGIQILYHILNEHKDILAERVFAPQEDMEQLLKKEALSLFALESRRPLKEFDLIGFSLLYELNYSNVLNMLDLSGIPFKSCDRDLSQPILIAGGPSMCNPEPIADFFDAIVIGDGEQVILEMAKQFITLKDKGYQDKTELLTRWQEIEGVYIPQFYDPASKKPSTAVKRTIISDLEKASFPTAPVVPFGKPIHDRLRIEVARGCTRGCRFCQAGMIYRPVRERSPENVLNLCFDAIEQTGYDDLSLLSLSTSDYTGFTGLTETLMDHFKDGHIAISLPSLRAGTLTPHLMELIRSVRKTGFTIAPEAGSQRLRNVINKNITEEDIFKTVEDAFALGWNVIKLYFMIGLPTETREDLVAIVDLVKRLLKVKGPKNKRGQINVSITTFIPKPHTPFQWEPQLSYDESLERINWFKDNLRHPKINVKWQTPSVSLIEGLFARGDRSLSELLIAAHSMGCKFDGWSDFFSFETWQKAIEQTGIDLPSIVQRKRDIAEPLPWDHIDMRIKKSFMIKERNAAFEEKSTPDCKTSDCAGCGICDFKELSPKTFEFKNTVKEKISPLKSLGDIQFKTVHLHFTKKEEARFLGHLEMMNIFTRALKKTQVPIKYSGGFHPMAKISFGDTLPMGMESECETLNVAINENTSGAFLVDALNSNLPSGISITGITEKPIRSKKAPPPILTYRITLNHGIFDEKIIKWFDSVDDIPIQRKTKKGKTVTMDLKAATLLLDLITPQMLKVSIGEVDNRRLRPKDILHHVFQFSDEQMNNTRIIKINDKDNSNQ